MTDKIYDHKGIHATADILLNSYPKDAVALFNQSLQYSNLTVVAEKVHQFTEEAATGVYVLAESSAEIREIPYSQGGSDIHEYPEVQQGGYICVSVFTCGSEGNPVAAIEHFLSLLDVKDANVKCFNRGHFEQQSISMADKAFDASTEELESMQQKMDAIAMALTPEQLATLNDVIDWGSRQGAKRRANAL